MATPRPICAVEDCSAPVLTLASGWCSRHYQRAKAHGGDPLGGRNANGTALAYFNENVMTTTTECKIWPFLTIVNRYNSTRYGRVWVDGKYRTTHSLACAAFHGPRPPRMDTCHLCGVGLCFNGAHLKWGTRQENMSHQLWHGTRNWGDRNGQARLTEAEAFNIRSRYLTGTAVDLLATEFGVSEGHIKAIGRGEKWKHLV
jgi:hypothetical protein